MWVAAREIATVCSRDAMCVEEQALGDWLGGVARVHYEVVAGMEGGMLLVHGACVLGVGCAAQGGWWQGG